MRFGGTAKVLAKCNLKHYRVSECSGLDTVWCKQPGTCDKIYCPCLLLNACFWLAVQRSMPANLLPKMLGESRCSEVLACLLPRMQTSSIMSPTCGEKANARPIMV